MKKFSVVSKSSEIKVFVVCADTPQEAIANVEKSLADFGHRAPKWDWHEPQEVSHDDNGVAWVYQGGSRGL